MTFPFIKQQLIKQRSYVVGVLSQVLRIILLSAKQSHGGAVLGISELSFYEAAKTSLSDLITHIKDVSKRHFQKGFSENGFSSTVPKKCFRRGVFNKCFLNKSFIIVFLKRRFQNAISKKVFQNTFPKKGFREPILKTGFPKDVSERRFRKAFP